MSDPWCDTGRTMKTLVNGINEPRPLTLIARFGAAELFERPDGRAELHGGSEAERTEVKEWLSLFGHDTVLRDTSRERRAGVSPAPAATPPSRDAPAPQVRPTLDPIPLMLSFSR